MNAQPTPPTTLSTSRPERATGGWRGLARRISVEIGRRTAAHRALPDFLMVGGQRCGTTSLFRALAEHPEVVRPNLHKGVNYFDLGYHRGPAWYAGHFPLRSSVRRRAQDGRQPQVFEASGYYLFHPFAIQRLAVDLPGAKIIAMLRDPVERAHSAWKHETARGYETEEFATALALEDQRLAGEVEKMAADAAYESFSHRHHAYRARGDYLTQLTSAVEHLPREQIHVLYSEDFFTDPTGEFQRLEEFLDLQPSEAITFGQHNARPSTSLSAEDRRSLGEHYDAQRAELEDFVGRPAPWPRATDDDAER